jgi:hypothetical protein
MSIGRNPSSNNLKNILRHNFVASKLQLHTNKSMQTRVYLPVEEHASQQHRSIFGNCLRPSIENKIKVETALVTAKDD